VIFAILGLAKQKKRNSLTIWTVIRASTVNQDGTQTAKYDEKGRSASFSNYVIAYNDNDNVILYQTYSQSKFQFTDKRIYDDKINPESLIPFRFNQI
jgi:hypothetical protein